MSAGVIEPRADDLVWKYPRWLLNAALVFGLAFVLLVTAFVPGAVLFLPVVMLAGVALFAIVRNPLIHLAVVLGSFVLIADFEEGIDIFEVAYALFYTSYLAVWLFRHILLQRRRLIESTTDILVITLLVVLTGFVFVGLAFDGKPSAVIADYQSWTLLAFYFPVKDAVSRDRKGLIAISLVLAWMGLFVVIRNTVWLVQALSLATEAWQVTIKGRVVTNEMMMIVPAFGSLVLALLTEARRPKLALFALSYLYLFGLIVTQGRGYWIAFAFGVFVLFFAMDGKSRKQIMIWLSIGISASILAILVFFGEYGLLLVAGLLNRILSIGSAASTDISLIGRFIEFQAVMEDIVKNPILGYGHGVPITYWDLSIVGTRTRPWIHNGYQSLWFKYGILGLGLVVGLTLVSIRSGFKAAKRLRPLPLYRATALMAATSLISVLVSTIPSNAWNNSDTILMITIMLGLSAGMNARAQTR